MPRIPDIPESHVRPNQPDPTAPPPPPAPPGPPARQKGRLGQVFGKPWVRYTLVGLVCFGIGAAVGGGGSGKKDDDKTTSVAAPQPVVTVTVTAPAPADPADPAAAPDPADPAAPPAAPDPAAPSAAAQPAGTLPLLVGQGLQMAQDNAQAAGYFNLASTDALGRDRNQVFDRNWQVCFQDPAPGPVATDTKVTFGAVKADETCPAAPEPAAPASASVGDSTPNVVGKSANVARDAFPGNASVIVRDVSGSDRMVVVGSNWQVCTQTPSAGMPFTGQPVTLGAVKFGESCP